MSETILIVGGGFSGLAAAETLLANGAKVVVLEAADRLGGRVRQVERSPDGITLEIGASYIGPTQPHMQALVRRFGATVERHHIADESMGVNHLPLGVATHCGKGGAITGLDLCFRADLETHDDDRNARRAIDVMDGLTQEIADLGPSPRWPQHLADLDEITLAAWMADEFKSSRGYTRNVVLLCIPEMVKMFLGAVLSVEPTEISALYFFWYLGRCGGFRAMTRGVKDGPDSCRVKEGYSSFIEKMAANIETQGGEIRKRAKVTSIKQTAHTVTAWIEGVAAPLHADRVIVAVPPFVARHIEFEADVAARVALHDAMQVGRTIKGYLVYDTPWWKAPPGAMQLDAVASIPITPRAQTFTSEKTGPQLPAQGCEKSRYPGGFSGYTNGTRLPVIWTMPMQWEGASKHALLWFIVGDHTEHYRALSQAERAKKVEKVIGELARFHHAPPATWATDHTWIAGFEGSDGGPAGYFGVRGLTKHLPALRAPVGRLHWASTETAYAWGGYMDGAIEAGVRAAHEVLGHKYTVTPPAFAGDPSDGPPPIPNWWERPTPLPPTRLKPKASLAGFAAVPLDVSSGLEMAGFGPASKRGARDEKGSLFARALYLEGVDKEAEGSGRKGVVFCAVDLLSCSTGLLRRVAKRLEAHGFSEQNIVLAGTHTHHAPGCYFENRFYDSFAQSHRVDSPRLFDDVLARDLSAAIASAIRAAKSSAIPAEVGFGEAIVWGHTANRSLAAFEANPEAEHWSRRPWIPNSTVAAPEDRNHQAVDPRVRALVAFQPGSDDVIGVFSTFSCHATSLGPVYEKYSRDWPGVAVDEVEAQLGSRSYKRRRVALALGGAGDVSPLPPSVLNGKSERSDYQTPKLRDDLGRAVGRGLISAIRNAKSNGAAPISLTVRAKIWEPPSPSEWNVGAPIFGGAEDGPLPMRGCWPLREGSRREHGEPKIPVIHFDALRRAFPLAPYHCLHRVVVNDVAFISIPGEPTAAFASRLETELGTSPRPVVLGYAGDYAGYFTTPEEYDAQHYEGASTLYGRRTYESILNAHVRLVGASALDGLGPAAIAPDFEGLLVEVEARADTAIISISGKWAYAFLCAGKGSPLYEQGPLLARFGFSDPDEEVLGWYEATHLGHGLHAVAVPTGGRSLENVPLIVRDPVDGRRTHTLQVSVS